MPKTLRRVGLLRTALLMSGAAAISETADNPGRRVAYPLLVFPSRALGPLIGDGLVAPLDVLPPAGRAIVFE